MRNTDKAIGCDEQQGRSRGSLRARARAALFVCGLGAAAIGACTPLWPDVDGGESGDGGGGAPTTGQGGSATGTGVGSGAGSHSGSGTGGGQTTSDTTTSGAGAGTTTGSGSTGSGETTGAGAGDPGAPCAGDLPKVPGCYWEPVCPDAPLDDIDAGYFPGGWYSAAMEATNRRYPSANCLFDLYASDVGNYADKGSFGALCESMMTMMHEETHGYDYEHALGNDHFSYYIRCDLAMETPWIDGFPRSEILPLVEGSATGLYDGTYLTGTQGTYGFVELLDEWNAYLNGMAAIGVVGDHVPAFGISGTDGAVAFAYYVELYLRVARTDYPSLYNEIKNDPQVKDLLRLQWNRMHFFLAIADKYPKLSIEAEDIKSLMYAADNVGELELVLGPLSADACN